MWPASLSSPRKKNQEKRALGVGRKQWLGWHWCDWGVALRLGLHSGVGCEGTGMPGGCSPFPCPEVPSAGLGTGGASLTCPGLGVVVVEPSTDCAAVVIKTTGRDTAHLGQVAFLLFLAQPLFSHSCNENALTVLWILNEAKHCLFIYSFNCFFFLGSEDISAKIKSLSQWRTQTINKSAQKHRASGPKPWPKQDEAEWGDGVMEDAAVERALEGLVRGHLGDTNEQWEQSTEWQRKPWD